MGSVVKIGRLDFHNSSMFFHCIAINDPSFESNLIVFTQGWFVSRVIKIGSGISSVSGKVVSFICLSVILFAALFILISLVFPPGQ